MGERGCVGDGRPGLSVSALLARARERRSGAGDAVGQQALEAAPVACDRARVAHAGPGTGRASRQQLHRVGVGPQVAFVNDGQANLVLEPGVVLANAELAFYLIRPHAIRAPPPPSGAG